MDVTSKNNLVVAILVTEIVAGILPFNWIEDSAQIQSLIGPRATINKY